MKKTLISLLLILPLVLNAQVASNTPPSLLPSLSTNSTPTIDGAIQEFVGAVGDMTTNIYYIPYVTYAPNMGKKWGGGVGAFYNVSQYIVMGLRLDYINGKFWMPSGNATLQLPLTFHGITITPFGYAGVGIPVSGGTIGSVQIPGTLPTDNNGQPTAILGEGLALRVYKGNASGQFLTDIIVERETWSGFNNPVYHGGISVRF